MFARSVAVCVCDTLAYSPRRADDVASLLKRPNYTTRQGVRLRTRRHGRQTPIRGLDTVRRLELRRARNAVDSARHKRPPRHDGVAHGPYAQREMAEPSAGRLRGASRDVQR